MKNLFFAFIFSSMSFSVLASGELKNEAIQQEATTIARSLVGSLKLNELEYIKVRELMVQRVMALNDIADYYQYDPALMAKKTEAAKTSYETRLKYILNSDQLENYLALEKSGL